MQGQKTKIMGYDNWKLQTPPEDELEFDDEGNVLCCPVCDTPTKDGDYCCNKCWKADNDD